MRRRVRTWGPAILLLVALFACWPSASFALGTDFVACANATGFECGSVPVPLERSGAVPGTLSLSVERKRGGAAPSHDAVVALAGGPGQAALPLSEFIAQAIAPALSSRDLLVFDQRGTGASDPLSCPALEIFSTQSAGQLFEDCASEIGPARGAFTTEESVQDIEALRQAGGYEKLVLYGTSYGTKVALDYAEAYPEHVEALVLDSVVPPEGTEPFQIPTFQAIGGVIREVCADGACAGISSDPLADVARLAAQLRKRPLSGSVYDGSGKRHASTLDATGLLGILEAGDLNPALRALLPAAVRSALDRDPDPLLRLQLLSEGLIPNVPRESANVESAPSVDEALFATTTCEESPFPWQRAAGTATRLNEALAYLHAQPSSEFYPFDSSTAYNNSLVPDCASWPDASPPPPAPGALPNVPTLILSGEQDLRTPTAYALRVAALIPDAQLLLVPFTGHSVLGSDLSDCSSLAVKAFFAVGAGGGPIQQCTPTVNQFAPTPLTPTKLAYVHPPATLGGRPGRTLVAVLDTLVDLNRQVIAATLQADAELPSGSSFGGLRGGYARLTSSAATLHDFAFVPGVQLTATFPVKNRELQAANIRVSGKDASVGTVRFGAASQRITGMLGGRRFDVSLAKVKLASVGAGEWPSRATIGELLGGRQALLERAASPAAAPRPSWLP
ncbi:MAG TPA: alpha/beta fold hydrolase [Solirubrobacteraceae bacterium]|jgi:pimeloyl-ACP methyl ester carboxylesterase|nr:alpha/beta fold hydrolase [Solirubrobacteraceae bacterium]